MVKHRGGGLRRLSVRSDAVTDDGRSPEPYTALRTDAFSVYERTPSRINWRVYTLINFYTHTRRRRPL